MSIGLWLNDWHRDWGPHLDSFHVPGSIGGELFVLILYQGCLDSPWPLDGEFSFGLARTAQAFLLMLRPGTFCFSLPLLHDSGWLHSVIVRLCVTGHDNCHAGLPTVFFIVSNQKKCFTYCFLGLPL